MEDNAGTAAQDFDITAGLTPVEAAELLGRLERGHQKAYQVAREFWRTPEWKTRKAMSEELDAQSVDALWAIYGSGIRQPGETLEEFTARARREAEPTDETQLAGDMTQEQRDRAAEFSEGYRRGQGDAWNGTLEECGGTDERYEAGYAAGRKWGSAHPAPYGKAVASEVAEAAGADLPARPITDYLWSAGPAGEQEHETGDACACGFSNREDDGFDQVVSYAEDLEARATGLPDDGSRSQAVIDGVNNGSIDPADLDVGFWAAKAAEAAYPQESSVADPEGIKPGRQHGLFALGQGVIIDDGPTERQLNDWNIANDHAEDGADLDYDRDYEAE
jgi:hypothetical protein